MEYTLFFPQLSNFVISVLAFVLCLSIIVFVHEFGHYFIGKLSGIHAEVFSIGFGPVIISAYDKRGTKWQIAAFPLGIPILRPLKKLTFLFALLSYPSVMYVFTNLPSITSLVL